MKKTKYRFSAFKELYSRKSYNGYSISINDGGTQKRKR